MKTSRTHSRRGVHHHYPRRALNQLLLVPTLVALAACQTPALPHAPTGTTSPTVNPFSWLQGCWQTDDGVEETWVQTLQGDQLFGYSVVSSNGKRVFFEQLRLDVNDRLAVLHAYPSGVGPTPFTGSLTAPQTAEFVNADNDFPQRIRYTLSDSTLTGYIADLEHTRTKEWRYRPCHSS